MATYRGKPCKEVCDGHRAGYGYANRGGRKLTKSSSSFNTGMRIAQADLKAAGTRTRFIKPK